MMHPLRRQILQTEKKRKFVSRSASFLCMKRALFRGSGDERPKKTEQKLYKP